MCHLSSWWICDAYKCEFYCVSLVVSIRKTICNYYLLSVINHRISTHHISTYIVNICSLNNRQLCWE